MSFSDSFKRRMGLKGNSQYDRGMARKQRSFEVWFKNTLTRHSVLIDGKPFHVAIQDQNQSNNKGLSDDKYIMMENTTPCNVGSIIDWSDEKWIVFSHEYKTIQTHKQQMIKKTNHQIKWVMKDGKICNNGEGYRAYVQNNTLYTLGVAMSGNNAWVTNSKMAMYLPYSDEAKNIPVGQRVIIGDSVYQIMLKDFVSRTGLIYCLLEEDFYNPNMDDMENQVADRWLDEYNEGETIIENNDKDNNTENVENYVLTLESTSNLLKVGRSITINAVMKKDGGDEKIDNPISEWIIADVDGVTTITEQTENYIVIKVANNFSFVGKQFTVVGKALDETMSSKTINVVSPY